MSKDSQEKNGQYISRFTRCEFYVLRPNLRYKKKEIELDNGTVKTEYRLQQMWQGSDGSQKWDWVDYIN